MKPCKPQYEHIDQDEFGDGRKITTSLLTRFCNNISGLWKKTRELEDNTDPELRKTFTPPIIHDMHSYGITLNENKQYEFDNNTQTVFLDSIGLKTITITDTNLTKEEEEEEDGTTFLTKKLETTDNIQKIDINKTDNTYPPKTTLKKLKKAAYGYYLNKDTNKLYIKPQAEEKCEKILITVFTDDPYIDRKNTTAHIN